MFIAVWRRVDRQVESLVKRNKKKNAILPKKYWSYINDNMLCAVFFLF